MRTLPRDGASTARRENHRSGLFQRRRRTSRRRRRSRGRHPRAGPSLAGAQRQPVRGAGSARRVPADHGDGTGDLLQRAAEARLDARAGAGIEGAAGADPAQPQIAGGAAAPSLARDPAGSRGIPGAQFQSRHVWSPDGPAARAVRHDPDRPGGLPAAFLDRATADAAFDLRHAAGGGAGAGSGLRRPARAPDHGNDHPAGFLRRP